MHPVLQVLLCLLTLDPAQQVKTATLIQQLGSRSFEEREAASLRLEKIGTPALDALRAATASKDAEVRRRTEQLVRRLEQRQLAEDDQALRGTWHVIAIEGAGQTAELGIKLWEVQFRERNAGQMTVATQANSLTFPGTYELSWHKGSRTVDFSSPRVCNAFRAIYRLEGDSLRLCVHDGPRRPEKFDTQQGWVLVLRRARESKVAEEPGRK